MTTIPYQKTKFALLLAAIAIVILSGVHARTWTSADGAKTFDGELQPLSFLQGMLSEADITF
jgi:hypothetical protein